MPNKHLALTPGNWDDLNDFLGVSINKDGTLKAAAARYVVASDGTTVTGYDQNGAAVVSNTDGGAVLTALLPAANSAGAAIMFRNDGNVFPWGTVPALPKGLTNKLLIRGNGATVQLSAGGPRFLDFNKVADYDTFQNITVEDFTIDCNNIGGKQHVVLGTFIANATTTRVNFDSITVRGVRTVNVPVDQTLVTNHRLNVWLCCAHAASGEGTQNTIKNILVENCDFWAQGNFGVAVDGVGPAPGVNVFIDDVTIRNVRHSVGTTAASALASTGSFQIGSRGFGGSARIIGCHAAYAADVCFEANSLDSVLVEDCTAEDAFTKCFLFAEFQNPRAHSAKRVTFRNCRAYALTTDGIGFVLNQPDTSLSARTVTLEGCSYYKTGAAANVTGQAILAAISGGVGQKIEHLKINDFTAVHENIASTGTSNHSLVSIAFNNVALLSMRGVRLVASGAASSGTVVLTGISLLGGTHVIDADDIAVDFNLSGAGISQRGFDLGASIATTLRGSVRRLKVMQMVGDAAPRAVQIRGTATLTVSPRLVFRECDFTGMAAGTEFSFVSANQNQATLDILDTTWRVHPKPSAAMGTTNFAAGTFTTATGNQYIGGSPADIHFATGTGAGITAIDVSKDGATYENAYTQASGAMANSVLVPVDNGDSVKVTFATTQPTTRVRFRR